ncbi:hypothetical protein C479_01566 [Halovivax asiaticus JCM 14624]|uniref:Uncharacterized protein n=1 Tax=Halovivax asiaticus JCM 14624 TaxID=1227490 RepID=M0BTR9_9EURY|nr:hypothetical protein [Halovivax asiaticus]ELZ13492.1 hypothetical protein C479_01566 [Halovivax asiaticus JCM 14624]
MCTAFGEDDVGKSVVNASGEEIGMVTAVEHGTAHVTPDPGVTDSIKAALGWEGTGENAYPLQEESVERVTGDEIRLSGDLHDETVSGGAMDTGREAGHDRGVSSTEMGSTDTPADRRDGSAGRSDTQGHDDEATGLSGTGAAGDDESTIPDRDATGRVGESDGLDEPADRSMDDSAGAGPEFSEPDRAGRGRSSSPERSRDEGEAMDPAVGDGDRTGGTDDELTDADRDIHDRDRDTGRGDQDSDMDAGLADLDSDSDQGNSDSDSDSDTDRELRDRDSDTDTDQD